MNLRKYACRIIMVILTLNFVLPLKASALTDKNGLLLGDVYNNYILYDDLTTLSSNNNIMLNASEFCSRLGLSYHYDESTKKITIKNDYNGKYLTFVLNSSKYTYYTGNNSSKGITKNAWYKAYYDKKNKCNVIHYSSLSDIIYFKNFKISAKDKYYAKLGYKSISVYSKYNYRDKLQLPSVEYSKKTKPIPEPVITEDLKETDLVTIEDPTLREMVCDTLETDPKHLTYGEMLKLDSLYLSIDDNSNITNLKGLENARNLKILSIMVNYPEDICLDYYDLWTISTLDNLEWLNIEGVMLYDLDFLKNLNKLEDLNISYSYYRVPNTYEYEYYSIDISAIQKLMNLKFVSFDTAYVKDLTPISHLHDLECIEYEGEYELGAGWSFDANSLKNNTSLKAVAISYAKINNIMALKNIKNLKALVLSHTSINNINSLAEMRNLEYIKISGMTLTEKSREILRKANKFAYIDLEDKNKPDMVDVTANEELISEITPDIEKRLKSYPYYRNFTAGYTEWCPVKYSFNEIMKQRPELAKWICDNLLGKVITLDKNEKLYISENLTYVADMCYVARGILQVKNNDGSFYEYDMEVKFEYWALLWGFIYDKVDPFEDDISNPEFRNPMIRYLSYQRIIKK